MINNLIDIKVKNPSFDDMTFTTKYNELITSTKQLTDELAILEKDFIDNYDTKNRLAKIEEFLNSQDGHLTELNIEILKAFVYRIIVVERDEVVFCIAGTHKYNDEEFIEKRKNFLTNIPIHEGLHECEKLQKSMKYKVIII